MIRHGSGNVNPGKGIVRNDSIIRLTGCCPQMAEATAVNIVVDPIMVVIAVVCDYGVMVAISPSCAYNGSRYKFKGVR